MLTESSIFFYKPKAYGDDDTPFFSTGWSLRTGPHLFGSERGRMALANADLSVERVREDAPDGVQKAYTLITLTAGGVWRFFESNV